MILLSNFADTFICLILAFSDLQCMLSLTRLSYFAFLFQALLKGPKELSAKVSELL